MRALSIRAPWAWAIIHGGKNIENRSWQTHHRGPLLIHAGKAFSKTEFDEVAGYLREDGIEPPKLADLLRGGIVGQVEVAGIVTKHKSPWFGGPYGWVLKKPQPLPFIPYRGQQGLFRVDPKLLRA